MSSQSDHMSGTGSYLILPSEQIIFWHLRRCYCKTTKKGVKSSCKPDSVFVWPSLWDAGRPAPQAALGARQSDALPGDDAGPQAAPAGLAPDGVYPASASPPTRCALTAPFRPYRKNLSRRYVSVALSVGSPRPAVNRHRCPGESGLSSAARLTTGQRPPG